MFAYKYCNVKTAVSIYQPTMRSTWSNFFLLILEATEHEIDLPPAYSDVVLENNASTGGNYAYTMTC